MDPSKDQKIYRPNWVYETRDQLTHTQIQISSDARKRRLLNKPAIEAFLQAAVKERVYSHLHVKKLKDSQSTFRRRINQGQMASFMDWQERMSVNVEPSSLKKEVADALERVQKKVKARTKPTLHTREESLSSIAQSAIVRPVKARTQRIKLPKINKQDYRFQSQRIESINNYFDKVESSIDLRDCLKGLTKNSFYKFFSFFQVEQQVDKHEYKKVTSRLLKLNEKDCAFLSFYLLDNNSDGLLSQDDLFQTFKQLRSSQSRLERLVQQQLFKVNRSLMQQQGSKKSQLSNQQKIELYLLKNATLRFNQYLKGVYRNLRRNQHGEYEEFSDRELGSIQVEHVRRMRLSQFREDCSEFIGEVRRLVLQKIEVA